MPYQATVVNVMIASPGDVAAERHVIQSVIHKWNSINSEERQTVLLPMMWETHSIPEMGDRAQAIINRQVLAKCDLLVAAFWTRLGSPTGSSPSGTVEEIHEHLQLGKPAMIYFSKKPVDLDSVDISQYEALKAFRTECEKTGLIATHDSLEDFSEKFYWHLSRIVQDRFAHIDSQPQTGELPTKVSAVPNVSEDARLLLLTAAQGSGEVLRLRILGGTVIKAADRQFTEIGNRRDEARWNAALKELVDGGLLEAKGNRGEIFAVTHAGYDAADTLKSEVPSTPAD